MTGVNDVLLDDVTIVDGRKAVRNERQFGARNVRQRIGRVGLLAIFDQIWNMVRGFMCVNKYVVVCL